MSVTLATHCHSRDLPRLHAPGVLEELISCHNYLFSEILVTHQRCGNLPYALPDDFRIRVLDISEEDYEPILKEFGIPHKDPELTRITHDWNWQWYYEHHCVNHCKELLEATNDYIVFNDADCRIITRPQDSWIERAIDLLETYADIFIVSPSDGGHEVDKQLPGGVRCVKTTSQQLFMGNRERLRRMNFAGLQWDGKFDAPGGPFQEWYGLFEGHIGRWMKKYGLYRAILPEKYRYWHSEWH